MGTAFGNKAQLHKDPENCTLRSLVYWFFDTRVAGYYARTKNREEVGDEGGHNCICTGCLLCLNRLDSFLC